MSNSYQLDFDTSSLGNIFYRLRDLFRLGSPNGDEGYLSTIQHILGDMNVIDHDVHPDSPRRNRPAHLSGYEFDITAPSSRQVLSELKEIFRDPDVPSTLENLTALQSVLKKANLGGNDNDVRRQERTRSMSEVAPKDWGRKVERDMSSAPKKKWDKQPSIKDTPAPKKDWGGKSGLARPWEGEKPWESTRPWEGKKPWDRSR